MTLAMVSIGNDMNPCLTHVFPILCTPEGYLSRRSLSFSASTVIASSPSISPFNLCERRLFLWISEAILIWADRNLLLSTTSHTLIDYYFR